MNRETQLERPLILSGETHKPTPGRNVDKIHIGSGLKELRKFCEPSLETEMVIEHALMRHARGEEAAAERGAIDPNFHGIDFTGWRRVLAAAIAGAK